MMKTLLLHRVVFPKLTNVNCKKGYRIVRNGKDKYNIVKAPLGLLLDYPLGLFEFFNGR